MTFDTDAACERIDRCMSMMSDSARAAGFSRDEVIVAVCVLRNGALELRRPLVESVERDLAFSAAVTAALRKLAGEAAE